MQTNKHKVNWLVCPKERRWHDNIYTIFITVPLQVHSITNEIIPLQSGSVLYEHAKLTGVLYKHRVIFTKDGRITLYLRKWGPEWNLFSQNKLSFPFRGLNSEHWLLRQMAYQCTISPLKLHDPLNVFFLIQSNLPKVSPMFVYNYCYRTIMFGRVIYARRRCKARALSVYLTYIL